MIFNKEWLDVLTSCPRLFFQSIHPEDSLNFCFIYSHFNQKVVNVVFIQIEYLWNLGGLFEPRE